MSAAARPWLKHYMKEIPAEINADKYESLIEMFEETFEKYHDLPAFDCMGKNLKFSEINRDSRNFAAYLQSIGLQPGDRIAIMMPNLLQYPIALFGALRAGLIVVNTNPMYTPREMKHQFRDSGATAIVIVENFAEKLQEILPETQIKHIIVASIGEMLSFPKSLIVNFVVRHVKKMVPDFNLKHVTFKAALAKGSNQSYRPHNGQSNDTILLQYTGGTTGVSKGAMLTNRNLVANMLQIRSIMAPFLKEGKEIALAPLPMYHIFAFTVNCLALMGIGTRSILVTNARDIQSVLKEIKNYPITLIPGINTLFNAMLNHPEFEKLDFSHLKITVGGGMAVQPAVAERWRKVTGCYLTEGYGLTETSPVAVVNPFDGSGMLGCIGLPVPSTDVRIVDDNYQVLDYNQTGEIQIHGPQVMKGYFHNEAATADIIKDGWLCTGDIGFMDPEGFIKIVDRKKDMILVSGFNVYPNEIEEVVAMLPKVFESAAVGVKDDKSGEVVKLFVVKKDPSLTEEELIAHCKANLTAYKVPKHIEFRDELPKTNVGKILRRMLKE